MNRGNYVISIKRILNHNSAPIPENEQYFEYAGFDRYSGAMSSGYPVFLDENHAERFETEEEAKAWWERNKNSLLLGNSMVRYDTTTLAIRKISYRKIQPLYVLE